MRGVLLRCNSGISELQGSLVLLAVILIAVLAVKSLIGDSIISAALDFGQFKVWGAHNDMTYSKSAPGVTITNPPDGSRFYSDQYTIISGNVLPARGRSAGVVYFRINGGAWTKATVNNNVWSTAARYYMEGSYHVEAVAYDDTGEESPIASSTFETIFRLYPDADYIEDDAPTVMTAGDPYDFHIKFLNTGYLPWNDSAGYMLSPNGSTMALSPIGIGGSQVQPNASRTFNISFTAPQAGDHMIGYRMWCTDFGWFGDQFSKPVKVVESYHDAKVISMNMPTDMNTSDTRTVSITMQNTGTAAWFASGTGQVYLGMVDGITGDAYKFNGSNDKITMAPGTVVRNGSNYTFQFQIKAPAPGSYYTQYRMTWNGHYAYGQIAGCTINVKALPTPTPTPTATPNPIGPKPTPTPTPLPQYNAHGKMTLKYYTGEEYRGPLRYYYDGPLGKHFERSSRGASDDNSPTWDWDIGGPNGHYRIYNDVNGYSGGLEFDMNNGGNKGKVVFYKN